MWDYWRTHIRGCSSTVGLFALQGWQQHLWWVNGRRWKGQSKTVRSLWAVFRSNTVNVIKPTPWYNTVFRFHEAGFFYLCDYERFTCKIAYKDTSNLLAVKHQAGLYRVVLSCRRAVFSQNRCSCSLFFTMTIMQHIDLTNGPTHLSLSREVALLILLCPNPQCVP